MTPTGIAMSTAAEIMTKCNHVDYEIKNEAELRYCVGDPILQCICTTWGYKARLEESVKAQRRHIQVSLRH